MIPFHVKNIFTIIQSIKSSYKILHWS